MDADPNLEPERAELLRQLARAQATTQAAQAEAARLRELLDLAQHFGHVGVWERELPSLRGHWDAQVFGFWGMAPAAEALDLSAAIHLVAAADQDALSLYFRESTKRAGTYRFRYRIRQPDGTLRRLHSTWIVKNGADGLPERMVGLLMDDSESFPLARTAGELESQLALAVDLGGIALWRHDLATQRMHYNEQAWRVLGVPPRPEGLAIEEVRDLIHPDDLPQVLASAQAALVSDRPTDMEARYKRSDGSWRDVMTRRVVQRDAVGKPLAFVGVAMDVTERVEQTRQAAGLLRRFELVTRTAGIGHWSVQGRSPQAQAQWSDTLYALFGLPSNQPPPPMPVWVEQHVHPAERALVKQAFAGWKASGDDSLELAFRIVRPDGTERQLVSHTRHEAGVHASESLLFGVVIDITQRRTAEQALRRANERVALATRAVGLGTWEVDLRENRTFWDEGMWALRGRAPRASAPTLAERLAFVHPDDRERIARSSSDSAPSRRPLLHEFRVIWPDGQQRWIASRSLWLFDEAGVPVRRLGVNWDVTDTRTAERVQLQHEMALRESQDKSRFLARMSHELRTPLNAVLGFTQLLLADKSAGQRSDSAARQQQLEHIHAAGRHLLALINDVLDLSSLQSGELRIDCTPLALAPLVAQTLPLLGPRVQADAGPEGISVTLGELDLHVMADATRLRQVLLNLLSNAVKYNRPGGQVHISAHSAPGQVVLQVSDTGQGMDAMQLRQVFEPFNRLGRESAAVEGHGIGLAIVKALVECMGGQIDVTSQLGHGTTFEVRLPAPLASEPFAEVLVNDFGELDTRTAGPRRRILYIEDNPVNALIIEQLLERRSDLSLSIAEDGARGVAMATEWLPELILLDMQLPDFDGIEVMRRLRAQPQTARIPCVALSANAMPQDIESALRAGAAGYWTKPLDFKAFMARLDSMFGPAG